MTPIDWRDFGRFVRAHDVAIFAARLALRTDDGQRSSERTWLPITDYDRLMEGEDV